MDTDRASTLPRAGKSNFLGMMANFNIQYNFTSASIAVQILSSAKYLGYPLYAEPAWSDNVLLAVVFIGAMLGMVCMGRLGDVLGRSRAMRLTTALAMVGSIIPACVFGSSNLAYSILSFGRLILGIGVGGIYPLSAVHSAEGSATAEGRGNRVSWAFFWQTPGVIIPYFFAMLLLVIVKPDSPEEWVPQLQFRLLFALGALPAAVVFLASFKEDDSADFQSRVSVSPRMGLIHTLRSEPLETRLTLLGTAGSWFCYDIAFYGTSVFQPAILDSICMSGTKVGDICDQTILETAWQSVLINFMGVPGCLCAILLMKSWGSKRLNVYGFLLLTLNFVSMGVTYAVSPSSTQLLFAQFCSLTFLLNFGPNIGTFVLPAICFPGRIRSTCHGLSAFGGKLGAVLGTLAFPIVNASAGLPCVLYIQAGLCVVGAILSHVLLRHDWHYLSEDDRCAIESFVEGSSL